MSGVLVTEDLDRAYTRNWVPQRITLARGLKGMFLDDVAEAIGIPAMEMLAYEQGREAIPDVVVAGVARLTGFLPAFFAREMTVEMEGVTTWLCPLDAIEPDELCSTVGCKQSSEAVCDFPVGGGKTCDLGICLEHRVMVREGIDICDFHRTFILTSATEQTVSEITKES